MVSISPGNNRVSFLKKPWRASANHGGISPLVTLSLIPRAHGRTSS